MSFWVCQCYKNCIQLSPRVEKKIVFKKNCIKRKCEYSLPNRSFIIIASKFYVELSTRKTGFKIHFFPQLSAQPVLDTNPVYLSCLNKSSWRLPPPLRPLSSRRCPHLVASITRVLSRRHGPPCLLHSPTHPHLCGKGQDSSIIALTEQYCIRQRLTQSTFGHMKNTSWSWTA